MKKLIAANWSINIVIIACAVIIFGVLGSRYYLIGKAREHTEIKLSTVLTATIQSYKDWVNLQIIDIQQWPRDMRLLNNLTMLLEIDRSPSALAKHYKQQDIRALIQPWLTDRGYQGFFIIAPDGTNLASTRDSNLGAKNLVFLEMRQDFQKVLAGNYVVTKPLLTDVEIKDTSGRVIGDLATMFTMGPMFNELGEVIAIFAVRQNPVDSFSSVFQRGHLGLTGKTYALDKRGRLLTESRFNSQLQISGLLKSDQFSTLNIEIRDPGADLTMGDSSKVPRAEQPLTLMARRVLSSNNGSNLDGYSDYRGVEVVGTWIWDSTNEIGIATEINKDEAYSNLAAALTTLYVFASASIFILGSALYVIILVRNRFLEFRSEADRRQNLLERILGSAGEGIYGLDSNGITSFVNPKVCEILGYSDYELVGQPMHTLVHHSYPDGSEYPREKCHMYQAFSDGLVHKIDDEVLWRKDGTSVPISYTSTPIWSENKLNGAVVVFHDITEELIAKEQLQKAKDEAEAANKAKSTFLSSMSHELRTPLNAILGFGQILQNEPVKMNERQLDFVNEMINGGSHLLSLINDVLELSKIDAGEMILSMENINVEEVIDDCLSMISMLASRNGITIVNETKGKDLPFLYTDFLRLKQALLNFLSNAIKYNRRDGTVTIDASPLDDNYLHISVSDIGKGIPAVRLAELWEPFNRLGAETTNIEGTGIGLSVTKSVIDLLGGRIGVESKVGQGSTFWVDIPLAHDLPEGVSDITRPWSRAQDSDKKYDFSVFSGSKILYVEDTPSNQSVLKSIFSPSTGVTLQIEKTAHDGLKCLKTFIPDLIILDINLPDMDGFEIKKRILAMPERSSIPVIAMTANVNKRTQDKAEKLGFVDFLTKPIIIANLFASMSRLGLQNSRVKQE